MTKPTLQTVEPAAKMDAAPSPDPFDLANLRLSQSFVETAGVKKLLKTVPVHKPNPQDFVRVHPSPEFVTKTLFTAINRQSVVFLWPVRLPTSDGKQMEWWRSMREAAELAMQQWLRIKANMSLGAYEMFVAESAMSEPVWPEATYQDLIRLAFRDRLITSVDHPVIKRLRGLA
jgi:hypothetical protein